MDSEAFSKNVLPLAGLVALIFILMFILANFGYIRACDIAGFSDVYYSIKGQPNIAIVSGIDGIGDSQKLSDIIASRMTKFAVPIDIESVKTGGVLDNYQMVIVDHAKTMDTASLKAFRDYVMQGGRLIWIGDAGTGLGENDYICEEITFSYLPAANYTTGNSSETQCGEWINYAPNSPENLGSGICGRNYGELIVEYLRLNKSIYDASFSSGIFPCPGVKNAYAITGNERINACIDYLKNKNEDITEANVMKECTYDNIKGFGVNYWNRGGTFSNLTGKQVDGFNFASTVLGMDYVSDIGAEYLYLQPIDIDSALINKAYQTNTKFYGVSNFSIVDTTGFEYRSSVIMNLKQGGNSLSTYPAIVTSSPVGPMVAKGGLVVYYAFPPEDLVNYTDGTYKGAVNLIDNMVRFAIC